MRNNFDKGVDNFFDDALKLIGEILRDPIKAVAVVIGIGIWWLYRNWEVVNLPAVGIGSFVQQAGMTLLLTAGIFMGLYAGKLVWNYKHDSKTFRYIQIMPHADDDINPEKLGDFMRRVHGSKRSRMKRLLYGNEWFTYLIHYRYNEKKYKSQFVFYIGAPADRIGSVEHHMNALYPRAEFFPVKEIDMPGKKAMSGRFTMKRYGDQTSLSLAKYRKDQLPGILKVMKPGSWIQLSFSPDSERKLKKRIVKAEKEVKGDKNYRERNAFDREEEKSFKTRFSGNEVSFNVTLAIASEQQSTAEAIGVMKKVATAVGSTMHDVNELSFRYLRHLPSAVRRYPLPFPYKMVWTGSEIANLFHLPVLVGDGLAEAVAKYIPHGSKSTQRLEADVLSDPKGFTLGELVHPLIEGRMVRILPQSLSYHWGLTGITGSGKSTLLNTFLVSFMEFALGDNKAPGFSFIDPKGETATIVLNQALKKEMDGAEINWDKFEWISFKDAENPPAMNLLYRMPGVPETVLVDQIMRIISEKNFSAAPQAERLLRKSIETLLADKEKTHTILGIKPLLIRPAFYREVMARLKKDPANYELIQFWEEEADDLKIKSQAAIMNRIDIFYNNTFLKRIFGQEGFSFPVKKWMDDGHMVFFNFSGMGEEETALIGGYLTYLYYRVADVRPDNSMMHQLVIDEAQRVPASILPNVIEEMRSKGLYLGVATQSLNNLDKKLQDDLRNIAGNMFVCGQGDDGSKVAANIFKVPQADGKDVMLYSPATFMNLPQRTVVIKTEENGKKVYCIVKVPPLDRYLPNGEVAKYGDELQALKSNKWTYTKAKELEKKNGLPTAEIDEAIKKYLTTEDAAEPKLMEDREEIVLVPNKKPIELENFGAGELNLFD